MKRSTVSRFTKRFLLALAVLLMIAQPAFAQYKIDFSDNDINYYDKHGNNVGDCSGASGIVVPSGKDNQQAAFNFFLGRQLAADKAAAIVGNLMQESGKSLDPKAVNPTSGAFGIAQWLGSRLTNLQKYAADHHASYTDFVIQLNFLWYEVTKGTEKNDGAVEAVKSAPDIEHATFEWEDKFERAGETLDSRPMQARIKNAKNILALYGRNAPSGGSTADSGCIGSGNGSDIVKIALSQVGTKASGNGGSGDPSCKYQGITDCSYEAWCADFVSWVYKQAGVPFTGGVRGGWDIPGAANMAAWFGKHGIWIKNDFGTPPAPGSPNAPQPGDVAHHVWADGGDHVNIVVSYTAKGVTIVGGNQGGHPGAVTTYLDTTFFQTARGWGRHK